MVNQSLKPTCVCKSQLAARSSASTFDNLCTMPSTNRVRAIDAADVLNDFVTGVMVLPRVLGSPES